MQELAMALHFGKPLAIQTLRAWAECGDRVLVEIEVIHGREFDPDNLVSAAKIPLDALKAMGCLIDDSPAHIELMVRQRISKHKSTFFRLIRLTQDTSIRRSHA
jgi:hypothetical protein